MQYSRQGNYIVCDWAQDQLRDTVSPEARDWTAQLVRNTEAGTEKRPAEN